MVRQTSLEAYKEIKENGLLSKRRWEVYEALYHSGPCTTNELFQKMKMNSTFNNPCLHARLNELRTVGCVRENGVRLCKITGMTVIEWDVTKNIPTKLKKPPRKKCRHCEGKGYTEESFVE